MLQGSAVSGAAMVSSSTNSDFDITCIWHMILGYMSERDMIELSMKD